MSKNNEKAQVSEEKRKCRTCSHYDSDIQECAFWGEPIFSGHVACGEYVDEKEEAES